jgi:hypothetical protein
MVEGVREQVRWRDPADAKERVAVKPSVPAPNRLDHAFELTTTTNRNARTQI